MITATEIYWLQSKLEGNGKLIVAGVSLLINTAIGSKVRSWGVFVTFHYTCIPVLLTPPPVVWVYYMYVPDTIESAGLVS